MSLKIERTRDMELVRSILAHPRIWPHIHEDGTDEPIAIDHDAMFWMLVSDDAPAGVFLAHARSMNCWEMHTCLLPRIWGAGANEAARLFRDFMFGELGCKKLVTNIPDGNRAALRFAVSNGMVVEGNNRASYLKNGRLLDQTMLGITYEEWKSCQ